MYQFCGNIFTKWFFVKYPEHRIAAKSYVINRVKFLQSYVRSHGSRPMLGTMTSFVFCHVSRPPRLSVTQATMFLAWEIYYGVFRNPMKIKLDSPKEISAP